ncbi:MAG: class I SAM-dependent methyltransferase [Geminicoccaceae bacterium]
MAEFTQFYGRALIYDIGMGRAVGRDFAREVDFLAAACARLAGRPLQRLAELACGPGYHTREAARRGIAATGIDLSADMIAFARAQALAEGIEAEWIEADMRGFRLGRPVDLVVTPFDGIDVLLTNQEILDHFRAVAAALAPGGIYVFDITHPRDSSPWRYGSHRYEGERDGIRVVVEAGVNGPPVDPATQIADSEMRITIERAGERQVILDRARERFLHPQEIVALADLSGALDLVAFHGDYDDAVPFDLSPRATRLVAVLRRRG